MCCMLWMWCDLVIWLFEKAPSLREFFMEKGGINNILLY